MRVFVTGSAGFIGFHLARRLLADGHVVAGYDAFTDYYDPALKRRRHALLRAPSGFKEIEGRLEDRDRLGAVLATFRPDVVLHMAAQAGVRYALEAPDTYMSANITGTYNLLEALKDSPPAHLLLASTSSVYGGNAKFPFAETDRTDFPVSLYAATKKATEALSHAHAHLFAIPTTCLRFFTVYGPWGRPDMALFKFVSAIENARPIDVFGDGSMRRDFTFIDDLVEAVTRLIDLPPAAGRPVAAFDSLSTIAPWRAVNIAGGTSVALRDYIAAIEEATGRRVEVNRLPLQPGDVDRTEADTRLLMALTGTIPRTPVGEGVRAFVDWFRTDYAA